MSAAEAHFAAAAGAPGECWIWAGSTDRDGYGLATVKDPKRTRGAHRLAAARARNVDVDELAGQVVMHTCDNPPCVNPSHLRVGTQLENVRDMHAKRRVDRGRTTCLKGHELTPENVYVHAATGKRRCATCHKRRQADFDSRRRLADV